MKKPEVRKYLP